MCFCQPPSLTIGGYQAVDRMLVVKEAGGGRHDRQNGEGLDSRGDVWREVGSRIVVMEVLVRLPNANLPG